MLIAVSAAGPTLEDPIDPRFGRCRFLVFVDPVEMSVEAVRAPGSQALGGAGTVAAQAVAARRADAVVTGSVGPNAVEVLLAAGVPVFIGSRGTVRQAIEAHRSGQLTRVPATTSHSEGSLR